MSTEICKSAVNLYRVDHKSAMQFDSSSKASSSPKLGKITVFHYKFPHDRESI